MLVLSGSGTNYVQIPYLVSDLAADTLILEYQGYHSFILHPIQNPKPENGERLVYFITYIQIKKTNNGLFLCLLWFNRRDWDYYGSVYLPFIQFVILKSKWKNKCMVFFPFSNVWNKNDINIYWAFFQMYLTFHSNLRVFFKFENALNFSLSFLHFQFLSLQSVLETNK